MKIDVSKPSLILAGKNDKKQTGCNLLASEDIVCTIFDYVDNASTNALLISKYADDYLIELTEMMDFFAGEDLLKEKKYIEFIDLFVNNHKKDLNLSNTLYNLTIAFYKLIEIESKNTPVEQTEAVFNAILNEIIYLDQTITHAVDVFTDHYERLKIKLLNAPLTDNKTFPSLLLRAFNHFDDRLHVEIDEVLYYKLLSALK